MSKPETPCEAGMCEYCESSACKCPCHKRAELGDGEPSPEISDEFVAAVEDEIGMGSGAWDMIHPDAICQAVIKIFQNRRSGAAQEVSPYNPIERKLLTSCPECGSRERDPRRALSTDSKRLYLCDNAWHDVEEVSPPSPEQFYESTVIPGFDKEFATYPDGWFKFAAAYRKFCGGDTRELKAALRKALLIHWLSQIECNHEEKNDSAICACGWKSERGFNVGKAVELWIDHVFAELE